MRLEEVPDSYRISCRCPKKSHAFGDLRENFYRVQEEKDIRARKGTKRFKPKPSVVKLTPEQHRKFEVLFEKYKEDFRARHNGVLTYRGWFSALCNARKYAKWGEPLRKNPKGCPVIGREMSRRYITRHRLNLYRAFIAKLAHQEIEGTRPVRRSRVLC